MVREIVARGEITLECHIIDARISTAMYRYFRPVLLHVKSKGDDGATSKSLSEDLFVGMESVSQKLLEICAEEKMVELVHEEDRFVISQRGRDAIDNGIVLVRDTRRMWKMYYTECELVPAMHRVLMLETGSNEADYQKGKDNSIDYLSYEISNLEGDIMMPILGKNAAPFRIEEFGTEFEKVVQTQARVQIHLHLARDSVWLVFTTHKDNKNIRSKKIKSEKTYGDVVKNLWDEEYGYQYNMWWDKNTYRLNVVFDETSSEERISMKKTLVFERPKIYGCQFDKDIRIQVDIWPKDEYEAGKWAKWLLGHRIGKLIGNNVYEKIKNDVTRTFSEFDIDIKDCIAEHFEDD